VSPRHDTVRPRWRRFLAPVGGLVREVTAPAFERHGRGHQDIALAWAELVGADLAAVSRPVRLAWPRPGAGAGEGATLTVHVEGPRAIELQHSAPRIIAAINMSLGQRVVERMRIMQAPVDRAAARARRRPAHAERPDRFTAIASPDLRRALARLDVVVEA
jgi:hypothetical protein